MESSLVDSLVKAVKKFEENDPVTSNLKICAVCEKGSSEWPKIFENDPWCSDLCKKVYKGELAPAEADQIQRNLTFKSS